MKKIFVLLFAMVAFVSLGFAQDATTPVAKATITFEKSSHDFGDIAQGEKVNYVFNFKNTGSAPLILQDVQTTCGCTATDWPRGPIAPGESAKIAASFDSNGKMGKQNKIITIYSNASNSPERVSIITNIIPKEAAKSK
jgi:hypothetical protein